MLSQNLNRDDGSSVDTRQMLLSQMKTFLDKHKVKECLELIRNDQMKILIANDGELMWDLIPLICGRLRGLNEFRFKTFQACHEMLLEMSRMCKPKEVLIALLAELENDLRSCDDNCFKATLKPLEYVLICLPTKRNETLKWVLSTLNSHIMKIQVPQELNLEGKERLLMEQQNDIKRINTLMPLHIEFIETFVSEVIVNGNCETHQLSNKTSNPNIQRMTLLKALLSLFHYPLLHLDLSAESQSESRVSAFGAVKLISKLQSNFYVLSERVDLISKSQKSSEDTDIQLSESSFYSAVANLSYLVTCEDAAPSSFIPCVYTHVYVLSVQLQFIDILLQRTQSLICEKGLMLTNVLLSKINENELESSFMDILGRYRIEKSLINIMIYSTLQSHRQIALKVFRRLCACLDDAGRYKFLYTILSQTDQYSGVKGLVIGMYKEEIFKKETDIFKGSNLHRMVKTAISSSLPQGVESDLLENNDTVFATLNLLRFVFLKDSKDVNDSKIWDIKEYIFENLLNPIHTSLDLSRAHYKLELRKLTEQKVNQMKQKKLENDKSINIEVEIGGGNDLLPNLPPDHQHKVLLFALQNFDLIESIVVRVEEIINE